MADDKMAKPEQPKKPEDPAEELQDECELGDDAAAAVSGGNDDVAHLNSATTQVQKDWKTYL